VVAPPPLTQKVAGNMDKATMLTKWADRKHILAGQYHGQLMPRQTLSTQQIKSREQMFLEKLRLLLNLGEACPLNMDKAPLLIDDWRGMTKT
jgi:Rps23 Pro-64 3,4-dihydroxylase Tpa1-like proline 4-hydroxylase